MNEKIKRLILDYVSLFDDCANDFWLIRQETERDASRGAQYAAAAVAAALEAYRLFLCAKDEI